MTHRAILVMGVAGSGKSTIGAALADALGGAFLDGDDYHPAENVAHMAAGQPLTDDMRWPWLSALASAVSDSRANATTVFACSALRRSYRDFLAQRIAGMILVYPDAPKALIARRMAARQDHFMPLSLLDSQFATLEVPAPDETPIVTDIDKPVSQIVAAIIGAL